MASVEMKVGSATTTREYTYDAIGNPTSHSELSPMAPAFMVGQLSQKVSRKSIETTEN